MRNVTVSVSLNHDSNNVVLWVARFIKVKTYFMYIYISYTTHVFNFNFRNSAHFSLFSISYFILLRQSAYTWDLNSIAPYPLPASLSRHSVIQRLCYLTDLISSAFSAFFIPPSPQYNPSSDLSDFFSGDIGFPAKGSFRFSYEKKSSLS